MNQWIDAAHERLEAARLLYREEMYADALSRAYFAVVSATRALLTQRGLTPKTHDGLSRLLGQEFRDRIDTSFFGKIRQDRDDVDYRLYVPDRTYAEKRLDQTAEFVETARSILKESA